jgi:hypothetical protein
MTKRQIVPVIFIVCVGLVYLLPFIFFGENSYITIHDNLDITIPWFKMFRDNNLFFKFNVPTKQFDGLSTLYYGHVNYSVSVLLYAAFNIFTAYVINYSLGLVFGFVSMFVLLRWFGVSANTSMLIALCYAVAPTSLMIPTGTLPFIVFIFLKLVNMQKFDWKITLLVFYPFFSSLTMILWFILGLWFVLIIVFSVKEKYVQYNLVAGFIMLLLGSVFVDIKLFYFLLFIKDPLLRGSAKALNFAPVNFLYWIKEFLVDGYDDVSTVQSKIILPLGVFGSIYMIFAMTVSSKGKNIEKLNCENARWIMKARKIFFIQAIILIVVLLSAIDYSGILNKFLQKYMPFVIATGFVWGRIYILNRPLWYILFALYIDFFVVEHIKPLGVLRINYKDRLKYHSFGYGNIAEITKVICFLLILGQIKFEMQYPVKFNDIYPTIYKRLEKVSRVVSYFLQKPDDSIQPMSYKEFYSVNLFNQLKKDIDYRSEKVAALGYHAAILTYNGFNTIDGYSDMVPLEYFYKFRRLVEPDFKDNPRDRIKFDKGEFKMYLFNRELDWSKPSGYKHYRPIELNIDMNVLVNEFECIYILSAARILNAEKLGLSFIKSYKDIESVYSPYAIYLYKTKS